VSGEAVGVATFHAHGLRIVQHWRAELGYDAPRLVVYGDDDARSLLREAVAAVAVDPVRWPLRELGAAVEGLRLGAGPDAPAEPVPAVAAAYEALLRRRGAVDYAAMLALPLRLFERDPRLLRLHQDAHRYLLADEFQDVSAAQYCLLRLLAERHRNLVVVGDPLQLLYGWRGADVRLLDRFRRDFPEARALALSQNFRSTGRIVALANHLGAPLDRTRRLWTTNPAGHPTVVHVAPDEGAEAAFVAGEIARLRSERLIGQLDEIAPRPGAPTYLGLPGPKPLLGWESVRDERAVWVVEGVFDMLTLRGWGLPTVALGGTRGRPEVIAALARFPRVFLALDADEAGRAATADLVRVLGSRAVPVALPGVIDPAELALAPNGHAALKRAAATAELAPAA
jgi:hypothetical protein